MTSPGIDRSDRTALYVTVATAVVAAVATAVATALRLVEVIPNRDVAIVVPLAGETADLPIGPDGTAVQVAVEEATVVVPHVAPATHFALIAEPIVIGLAIIGAILLLAAFCLNIARGRTFARGNVRLIFIAAGVLLGGWVLGGLFTTMAGNGALAAISDRQSDGIAIRTDLLPVFAILALGAIGAAFQVGERLQRETEGLV